MFDLDKIYVKTESRMELDRSQARLAGERMVLPGHVQQEFKDYLEYGRLGPGASAGSMR